MNLIVQLEQLSLKPIFRLNKGQSLVKGGRGRNPFVFQSCQEITDRFFCYFWKTEDTAFYVGSVSKDYKGKQNNLVGRIGNYLQNHTVGNTNKKVFEAANDVLQTTSITFGIFRFQTLAIDEDKISYEQCSKNGTLIRMIEAVLIGFYKRNHQCAWNGEKTGSESSILIPP